MSKRLVRGPVWRAAAAVVFLLSLPAPASAARPHQHGVAQLDIAVDPRSVTLELDTPLDSLLGFERAPRTDAERQRVQAAVARLQDAAALFRVDPAAGCKLARVSLVSAPLGLGGNAAGSGAGSGQEAPAAADKDGHADLAGRFEFSCSAGARAGFIEVGLFEAFAPLRRIELQVVTPKGQLKATLARPASRVQLAR